MAIFVTSEWVEDHLGSPGILILDPRQPTHYLQGHIKNAVNLPLAKAFDQDGRLRSTEYLVEWIGGAGLDEQKSPLVYDTYDGQRASMLAWLLEYLGRDDVHVMNVFFEKWVGERRELYYRPVRPEPRIFCPKVLSHKRATLEDVHEGRGIKLIDFRSRDEYTGRVGPEGKAGHIPGATNIVWQEVLGKDNRFIAPREELQRLVDEARITQSDQVVAYCNSGPRAAVGYLALKELGLSVRLFDGSYAEWVREDLPIETRE